MEILRTIAWLVGGIYATIPLFWLIIHPFADFWCRRYRAPLNVLELIWIALWIIPWASTALWRHAPNLGVAPLSRGGRWVVLPYLAVIPLGSTGLFIDFGGKCHFSINQVIGRTELEPDRQRQILVTTGCIRACATRCSSETSAPCSAG